MYQKTVKANLKTVVIVSMLHHASASTTEMDLTVFSKHVFSYVVKLELSASIFYDVQNI